MRKPRNGIAYHRLRNIMSQHDVAKELGISQSYYGRLERNPDYMNIGMARQLVKIFKVRTIDELFNDAI